MKSVLSKIAFCIIVLPLLAQDKVTYMDHVMPILEDACLNCHNPDEAKGGLDLSSYSATMIGGSGGVIAKSGEPDGSRIYTTMTHAEEPFMPPKKPKTEAAKLEVIKKWIMGGLLETKSSKAKKVEKTTIASVVEIGGKPADPAMPKHVLLEPEVVTKRANAVTALATSPWSPLVAIGGQKQVVLYDTDILDLVGIFAFPEGFPETLSFSRNGDLLLAGGGRGGKIGKAVAWDVKTGKRMVEVGREFDTALGADISPNHKYVCLGGPRKNIKIFDTQTGEQLHSIKKHPDWLLELEYSPDGVLFASGGRNGGLFIWEAESGIEFYNLKLHQKAVTGISWRADSNVLAACSEDGQVSLWEMGNGKNLKKWAAHGGGALGVHFSPDGSKIVSCGRDNRVKVWDLNGKMLREFKTFTDVVTSVTFTYDGNRIVTGEWNGQLKVWDAGTGEDLGEIRGNPPTIETQKVISAQQVVDMTKGLPTVESGIKKAADATAAGVKAREAAVTQVTLANKQKGDAANQVKAAEKVVADLNNGVKQAEAVVAQMQKIVDEKKKLVAAKTGIVQMKKDNVETKKRALEEKKKLVIARNQEVTNRTNALAATGKAKELAKNGDPKLIQEIAAKKGDIEAKRKAIATNAATLKTVTAQLANERKALQAADVLAMRQSQGLQAAQTVLKNLEFQLVQLPNNPDLTKSKEKAKQQVIAATGAVKVAQDKRQQAVRAVVATEKKLTDLKNAVPILNRDIKVIELLISEKQKAVVESVKTLTARAEADAARLQAELNAAKQDVVSAQNEVKDAEAVVIAATTEIGTAQKDVPPTEKEVALAQNNVNAAVGKVNAAKGKVAEAVKKVEAAKKQLANFDNVIKAKQEGVKKADERIAALRKGEAAAKAAFEKAKVKLQFVTYQVDKWKAAAVNLELHGEKEELANYRETLISTDGKAKQAQVELTKAEQDLTHAQQTLAKAEKTVVEGNAFIEMATEDVLEAGIRLLAAQALDDLLEAEDAEFKPAKMENVEEIVAVIPKLESEISTTYKKAEETRTEVTKATETAAKTPAVIAARSKVKEQKVTAVKTVVTEKKRVEAEVNKQDQKVSGLAKKYQEMFREWKKPAKK